MLFASRQYCIEANNPKVDVDVKSQTEQSKEASGSLAAKERSVLLQSFLISFLVASTGGTYIILPWFTFNPIAYVGPHFLWSGDWSTLMFMSIFCGV